MIQRYLALALVAGGVSACSDGAGGSDDAPSFDELVSEGLALEERYEDSSLTSVADMPTSGSATYDGVVGYSTSTSDPDAIIANPETVSSLTLTADFGSSDISGRAYDFQNADGSDVSGDLEITGGSISGNEFGANIDGTLNQAGTTISYDGELAGGFVDEDAGAVVGGGAALATTEDGDQFAVYGVFAAD